MITVATPDQRDRIVQTLVAAFQTDPALRLIFPDPEDYPPGAAAFFGHLFDKRVGRGAIWTIHEGASVAIWEPPVLPGLLGFPGLPDLQGEEAAAVAELELPEPAASRMRAYDEAVHAALPSEPFWYLGVLGTHPEHRGRRYGQEVMRAGLERAAAEGLPAYLETSRPANVAMYERAGWKVVAELTEPLQTWVMSQ